MILSLNTTSNSEVCPNRLALLDLKTILALIRSSHPHGGQPTILLLYQMVKCINFRHKL